MEFVQGRGHAPKTGESRSVQKMGWFRELVAGGCQKVLVSVPFTHCSDDACWTLIITYRPSNISDTWSGTGQTQFEHAECLAQFLHFARLAQFRWLAAFPFHCHSISEPHRVNACCMPIFCWIDCLLQKSQ
eukprot:s603_g8.t1